MSNHDLKFFHFERESKHIRWKILHAGKKVKKKHFRLRRKKIGAKPIVTSKDPTISLLKSK